VRDERTRRIAHHEIEEVTAEEMLAPDYAERQVDRVATLMKAYPPPDFDVFLQGFDSAATLYSAWPELLVQVGFTGTRFGATEAQLTRMRDLLADSARERSRIMSTASAPTRSFTRSRASSAGALSCIRPSMTMTALAATTTSCAHRSRT
jgi:hypothetical protein